ncbi:MAG: AAA family ATPase [Methanobacteriota archaeon]
MKIIAFTGMPFAGKTEAVQLAEEMKIPVVRMGDAVWEEVKKRRLPLNEKTVGSVANEMRNTHGMDIWAQRTVERIRTIPKTEYVVIDGIRNREEVEFFKKNLGKDFIIVAIDASTDVRKQRARDRKRVDDGATMHSFEERDKRELRWGLGEVIASADIVIPNEHDKKSFQTLVKQVLQRL